MIKYQYSNYAEYINIQARTTKKKADITWANKPHIDIISKYLKEHIKPVVAMCMGARSGNEVRYFKKSFPKCKIVGTDIMPVGKHVIKWDMHDIKRSWFNTFDFLYSNSWDHLYDPDYALDNWGKIIKEGGYLILETSDKHCDTGVSKTDPFGLNDDEIVDYITDKTGMEYRDTIKLSDARRALIWKKI